MAVAYHLGIRHGFTFSAGAIDYFLNMKFATKGWLLLPIGLVFGLIYYLIFVYVIKKKDLPTPGRVDEDGGDLNTVIDEKGIDNLAVAYVDALGGVENIENVDSCITRLRISLNDSTGVSEEELKKLGASGIIKPSKKNIQVIIGTKAEFLADKINNYLRNKSKR